MPRSNGAAATVAVQDPAAAQVGAASAAFALAVVAEAAAEAAERASRARTAAGKAAARERWRDHLTPLGQQLVALTLGGGQ